MFKHQASMTKQFRSTKSQTEAATLNIVRGMELVRTQGETPLEQVRERRHSSVRVALPPLDKLGAVSEVERLFGAWCFGIVWSLVLGHWSLLHSSVSVRVCPCSSVWMI
jgi:hypothetical protein